MSGVSGAGMAELVSSSDVREVLAEEDGDHGASLVQTDWD